jgi:hypothetical protein
VTFTRKQHHDQSSHLTFDTQQYLHPYFLSGSALINFKISLSLSPATALPFSQSTVYITPNQLTILSSHIGQGNSPQATENSPSPPSISSPHPPHSSHTSPPPQSSPAQHTPIYSSTGPPSAAPPSHRARTPCGGDAFGGCGLRLGLRLQFRLRWRRLV